MPKATLKDTVLHLSTRVETLAQENARLIAELGAAKPLAAEVDTLKARLAQTSALVDVKDAEITDLTGKLRGQIKRGNLLKRATAEAETPIVRSFAEASAIARERGITVQAAMRIAA